jgi:hypothetical protein
MHDRVLGRLAVVSGFGVARVQIEHALPLLSGAG